MSEKRPCTTGRPRHIRRASQRQHKQQAAAGAALYGDKSPPAPAAPTPTGKSHQGADRKPKPALTERELLEMHSTEQLQWFLRAARSAYKLHMRQAKAKRTTGHLIKSILAERETAGDSPTR